MIILTELPTFLEEVPILATLVYNPSGTVGTLCNPINSVAVFCNTFLAEVIFAGNIDSVTTLGILAPCIARTALPTTFVASATLVTFVAIPGGTLGMLLNVANVLAAFVNVLLTLFKVEVISAPLNNPPIALSQFISSLNERNELILSETPFKESPIFLNLLPTSWGISGRLLKFLRASAALTISVFT